MQLSQAPFHEEVAISLGLNIDLVEAIALGDDVVHPPFGHEGENIFQNTLTKYGAGNSAHPWQSCSDYLPS